MSNKYESLSNSKQHGSTAGDGSSDSDNDDNQSQSQQQQQQLSDLGPVDYPSGEHRLQHPYCLWYSKRTNKLQSSYSKALQLVGQVATVEQWWALYCHMVRLQELLPPTDLHLFKKGIQPMWEDPANIKGGKFVIRIKKGHVGRAWENLCMAMLGEQFMAGNEVCGVVVSIRYQEDFLGIWNRTAADNMTVARIRDALKRLLNLPINAAIEYKTHNESLKTWKTITHAPKS